MIDPLVTLMGCLFIGKRPIHAGVHPSMSTPLANIYARLPVAFTHGQGFRLWSEQGCKYLDALARLGIFCLAYGRPTLVTTIAWQAARLIHILNIYKILQQTELARRFVAPGRTGASARSRRAGLPPHSRPLDQHHARTRHPPAAAASWIANRPSRSSPSWRR